MPALVKISLIRSGVIIPNLNRSISKRHSGFPQVDRTRCRQNSRYSDEVDPEGGEVRSHFQIQDSLDLAGSLGSPKLYS